MAIIRRRRKTTAQGRIGAGNLALLRDSMPARDANKFTVHSFPQKARTLWEQHREAILSEWIAENPGTRPMCWWLFDAPAGHGFQLGRPGEWGQWPGRTPARGRQMAYLKKHQLLLQGEVCLE